MYVEKVRRVNTIVQNCWKITFIKIESDKLSWYLKIYFIIQNIIVILLLEIVYLLLITVFCVLNTYTYKSRIDFH